MSESDRVGAWLFEKQLLFVLLSQCREHLHRIRQAVCVRASVSGSEGVSESERVSERVTECD